MRIKFAKILLILSFPFFVTSCSNKKSVEGGGRGSTGTQDYEFVNDFSCGMALVMKNDKYGFIDNSGKEVIKPIYDDAQDFSEDLAWVTKDGDSFYIDKSGNKLIDLGSYPDVMGGLFRNGVSIVSYGVGSLNKKEGVINKTGEVVVKPQYFSILDYVDDVTIATKELDINTFVSYLIDKKSGKVIDVEQGEPMHIAGDGLINVRKDNKWGYANKDGEIVIPFIYDDWAHFFDGFAKVKTGNKKMIIDRSGNNVFSTSKYRLEDYSEGLVLVSKNNKFGFVDLEENVVIPLIYDFIYGGINDGLISAEKDGKVGIINTKNETVVPFEYESVHLTGKEDNINVFIFKKEGKEGLINQQGKILLEPVYKSINEKSEGWYLVRKKTHKGETYDFFDGKGGFLLGNM